MSSFKSAQKISKILGCKESFLLSLESRMEKLTGKKDVLDQITKENEDRIKEILKRFSLKIQRCCCEEILDCVLEKIKKDDETLFKILYEPTCKDQKSCQRLIDTAQNLASPGKGFFLKKEKACQILYQSPPENMLSALGYKDVRELLAKENFSEVFSALRFIESSDWMNNKFLKSYEKIKPSDFEERKVEVIVLQEKWLKIAKKFIQKKYHNLSHLKELGIIFIIPIMIEIPGETLRMFTLLLHYLNEVSFYSKLFKKYSESPDFSRKFISALRGEVSKEKFSYVNRIYWRIVQRYLAKENKEDFRLFEPHVNPETIHWDRAENNLAKLDDQYQGLDFSFWQDLDFVGDFFPTRQGKEDLVSFNLIDSTMSLVKKEEKIMVKYLYHHQEALWNKIFKWYIGTKEKEENIILDCFEKGCIEEEDIKNFVSQQAKNR